MASSCNYLILEWPLENNTKMEHLHVIFPCSSPCWSCSWILYLFTIFSLLTELFSCSFMEVTNDNILICLYLLSFWGIFSYNGCRLNMCAWGIWTAINVEVLCLDCCQGSKCWSLLPTFFRTKNGKMSLLYFEYRLTLLLLSLSWRQPALLGECNINRLIYRKRWARYKSFPHACI